MNQPKQSSHWLLLAPGALGDKGDPPDPGSDLDLLRLCKGGASAPEASHPVASDPAASDRGLDTTGPDAVAGLGGGGAPDPEAEHPAASDGPEPNHSSGGTKNRFDVLSSSSGNGASAS